MFSECISFVPHEKTCQAIKYKAVKCERKQPIVAKEIRFECLEILVIYILASQCERR